MPSISPAHNERKKEMISLHVSYRYLLIIVVVAALLCLMPARGADVPDPPEQPSDRMAQQTDAPHGEPAGADLSDRTRKNAFLHQTLYYAPCGHSVQRREKLPTKLVGLTRAALESEIDRVLPGATVTGFSAEEVDVTRHMQIPCPLHWVLQGGEDGMLCVLQNQDGETLNVVRQTDIPVTAAPEGEQNDLRDGRMFDDVQALEGYLESLSS